MTVPAPRAPFPLKASDATRNDVTESFSPNSVRRRLGGAVRQQLHGRRRGGREKRLEIDRGGRDVGHAPKDDTRLLDFGRSLAMDS